MKKSLMYRFCTVTLVFLITLMMYNTSTPFCDFYQNSVPQITTEKTDTIQNQLPNLLSSVMAEEKEEKEEKEDSEQKIDYDLFCSDLSLDLYLETQFAVDYFQEIKQLVYVEIWRPPQNILLS